MTLAEGRRRCLVAAWKSVKTAEIVPRRAVELPWDRRPQNSGKVWTSPIPLLRSMRRPFRFLHRLQDPAQTQTSTGRLAIWDLRSPSTSRNSRPTRLSARPASPTWTSAGKHRARHILGSSGTKTKEPAVPLSCRQHAYHPPAGRIHPNGHNRHRSRYCSRNRQAAHRPRITPGQLAGAGPTPRPKATPPPSPTNLSHCPHH